MTTEIGSATSGPLRRLLALLTVLTLLLAACGSSDDSAEESTDDTAAESTDESTEDSTDESDEGSTDEGGTDEAEGADFLFLDANGDGQIQIGVATPGPRDDGAFYQALVEKVEQLSADYGFAAPIIVDNIAQADAATELENLAAQGVDIVALGASEIADPLADVAAAYPDIFWYCSCGQGGYPVGDDYAMSGDDGAEINYTSGVATGLLLQDSGGESAAFIGCCNLGFETESFEAFELGLQAVDESFTATYIPTGDFNDVAAATEAFNGAVAEGADAIYPFLGGAHEPLVALANENGLITMSAGASDVCERTDLDYQIAVRFDGGDYLETIFAEILDGTFTEGTLRVFHVGIDPEPGAVICDATAEQEAALEEAYAMVASGDLAEAFGVIKGNAYGG